MIDERINKTLSELESNLRSIESARKQVEKTVNSYDGLKSTTAGYVSELGNVTTKVKELVDSIGKDYTQKIKAFEKDRETIVSATTSAIQELSNAIDGFNKSLSNVQTQLKYILLANVFSLVVIVSVFFLLIAK